MEQVEKNPKPLNELGDFVYNRTYSRWLASRGRREFWHETVKRAIEYNMALEYKHLRDIGIKPNLKSMRQEARKLFDNIYQAKQAPSGRTLWLGNGNPTINEKFVSGNFNCAFTNIEKWTDLEDVFYLLMVGTGVGIKSTKAMAQRMPKIRTNFNDFHEEYNTVYPETKVSESVLNVSGNSARIIIGDSKEGWTQALGMFFELLTTRKHEHVVNITFNYDYVRPHGERLHTFGGTASGPEPLREMFEGFGKVLRNEIDSTLAPIEVDEKGYGHVRPVHILDIVNLIGYNVVVGGVRRTAEIFLFDEDDYESMFAKYGINGFWTDEHLEQHRKVGELLEKNNIEKPEWFDTLNEVGARREGIDHRRMSNNSIAFIEQPDDQFMELVFEMMQMEGEPGFVNLGTAAKRVLKSLGNDNPTKKEIADKAYELGLNPCVEIILHSKNVCNLTTINVKAFVDEETKELDLEGLLEAQRLSARIGLRMTLVELELPEWSVIQQRDRLLGTSLTGWKDAVGILDYTEEQEDELKEMLHHVARSEADSYAKQLRVNAPMFVTAVKPEGTLSQVMGGVSSGLHWSHSPYYIRRIRIHSTDPLAKVARDLGWTIHAEVGTNNKTTEEDLAKKEQIESAKTLVIDFPVKSGAKVTKDDIDIDEQFDNYFSFQDIYTEMNTSNTMTVKPGEWEQARTRVMDGWDDFVGVSFLSHDGGTYTLAPYEAISEEEYNKVKDEMAPFDANLLMKYDDGPVELDTDNIEECATGVCPIR